MASIILDSSDDGIPDTPENVNIRGVIPKVNYMEGRGSQYAESPSVIPESDFDDSIQQSKGKISSTSGLEDSLVFNSTVNVGSTKKRLSKREIVSDSFDANFSLVKPSIQQSFNGSFGEDGSPLVLSKKTHRAMKAIISSDSSDDDDDVGSSMEDRGLKIQSRGAQVSLSDSEVDENELRKLHLENKSSSSERSTDIVEDTGRITNQESEESTNEFNADEDSDSDFVPSPRVTSKKLRPKMISSESDESSDDNEETHNTKNLGKVDVDLESSEDTDHGNSLKTDKSKDSFDCGKSEDRSNASQMSTSVQSNTSTSSEILSPFDLNKRYSDREVGQLQTLLNGIKHKIQQNERLLANLRNLPDNGSKIKAVISKLRDSESELVARLLHARENMDRNLPVTKSGSDAAESELESLKVKERVLRQKFGTTRLELLPDKGSSIRRELQECRQKIATLEAQIKLSKPSPGEQKQSILLNEVPGPSGFSRVPGYASIPTIMDERLFADAPAASQLYGGRINQARRIEIGAITQEVLKSLHDCLKEMPTEKDEESDPKSLKKNVRLFPHQRQALAWMIWRESKLPPGGILADDMGLGKTLTLLALIAKHRELMANQDDDESGKENKWLEKFSKNLIKSSATLVICPASLIGHWEKEVSDKLKSGTMKSLIYHGTNRGQSAKGLAKYDIIITTYGTVMSEMKGVLAKTKESKLEEMSGTSDDVDDGKNVQLLSIVWERIILDEAHQIRNPKSQTALAVCKLRAARRWAVTGTPIQNKELDMYSLIRFLRLRPFDEYRAWKVWVDNKTSLGQQRMNTLVRSMMLRRTKDQKSTSTGQELVSLPAKQILEHKIKLNTEERKVYDEVFSFSQKAMMNYMSKHQEKKDDEKYINQVTEFGKSALSTFGTSTDSSQVTNHILPKSLGDTKDVKAHHILVLLLRLRQICCHPGLISSMLDSEAKANEGIEDQDGEELDLISQMADMSLRPQGDDDKETTALLKKNPIFDESCESSKIATVISELKKLREKSNNSGDMEKAVIISQWTSMLGIVETHIKRLGMRSCAINGSIPVIKRGEIVNNFNRKNGGPQVMLLSLAAGGVGLNLVGANHLFLLDLHWNPQLEQQACDRIYRVGQEREVTIHKFLCEETVESRILQLQAKKLELANGVLTGAQARGAGKLTFDDLKTLFNLGNQQE